MSARPQPPAKITVLGAGSWGTTFAKVLADAAAEARAERNVCLWGRDPEAVERMARERRNERYVPGIDLPAALTFSSDLSEAERLWIVSERCRGNASAETDVGSRS